MKSQIYIYNNLHLITYQNILQEFLYNCSNNIYILLHAYIKTYLRGYTYNIPGAELKVSSKKLTHCSMLFLPATAYKAIAEW